MTKNMFSYLGKGAERVIKWLTDSSAWIAWVCLWLMTVFILIDIFSRRIFMRSTGIADELSGYFLVVIAFMAAAYTLVKGRHIEITAVTGNLPVRVQRWLGVVGAWLALAFIIIMIWYSLKLPLSSLRTGTLSSTNLQIPMFIPQFVTPVGLSLLALANLVLAIKFTMRAIVSGKSANPPLPTPETSK